MPERQSAEKQLIVLRKVTFGGECVTFLWSVTVTVSALWVVF